MLLGYYTIGDVVKGDFKCRDSGYYMLEEPQFKPEIKDIMSLFLPTIDQSWCTTSGGNFHTMTFGLDSLSWIHKHNLQRRRFPLNCIVF